MNTQTTCNSQVPLNVNHSDRGANVHQIITHFAERIHRLTRAFAEKHQLERLSDHQLQDIGLTRKNLDEGQYDVRDRTDSEF